MAKTVRFIAWILDCAIFVLSSRYNFFKKVVRPWLGEAWPAGDVGYTAEGAKLGPALRGKGLRPVGLKRLRKTEDYRNNKMRKLGSVFQMVSTMLL